MKLGKMKDDNQPKPAIVKKPPDAEPNPSLDQDLKSKTEKKKQSEHNFR